MSSNLDSPPLETPPSEERSPFTSIPDAFFRRRTGSRWLSQTKSASTSRTATNEVSFEVEHLGDIRAFDSGWLDDDVEEVMVVTKKDKKRRPLSAVVDSASRDRIRRSPYKVKLKGDNRTMDANQFEFIRSLVGDDGGETLLARKFDNGQIYTVKLVRKMSHSAARLVARMRNEQAALKLLTKLEVAFVMRLWWSFEDERAMYLVTAAGIIGLHERGLVHTDLRPECILIDEEGHVVISDFSKARFLRGDSATYRAESGACLPEDQMFHAPELVLGWDHDYVVDWWSFGLLLFWIFTRTHPFVIDADNVHSAILHSKIFHARLMEDYPAMDESVYRLVARCLQRNPALRIDGVGVKMHEYFEEIDWINVTTKRLPAPFSSLAKDTFPFTAMGTGDSSLRLSTANSASQDLGHFSFSWQRALSSSASMESTGSRATRQRRRSVRILASPGDVTVIPSQSTAPVDPLPDIPKTGPEDVSRTVSTSPPLEDVIDPDVSIIPSLSATPSIGLPLPSPLESRVGNLRKYASLNFDDLDSLASTNSSLPAAESSGPLLGHSESTTPLRKTKSILGISLESFRDADDSASSGSGRWTSKLRRRSQAGTPTPKTPVIPPTPPVPVPSTAGLPKGVEKIGNGIGYNHRDRRQAMNLASLTPRTCHALFSGRRGKNKQKRKDDPQSEPDRGSSGAHRDKDKDKDKEDQPVGTPSAQGQGREEEIEEDLMDEVMKEIYGDEWNAGASPDPDTSGAGMPWGDVLAPGSFEKAGDASFAGPGSTLRLVTSPSTPLLR
ncbi:hypothetical protein GSI_06919 [Ganoderma sinense ZZ0214-1]|uniref:Protein kinase domain-containing protein n=1 Tax=Ganoderma sinense ZZ0214-1 TaxID=1077348 RepID=A0A2G8SAH7_9APHY|nr:hypothetical protein GSI_06919 [Ganoderma sinense ZZ0214-1]